MNEIWKDIAGYEGWYQVSNFGRVKRLKKPITTHGIKTAKVEERILKPSRSGRDRGYLIVKISNGVQRKRTTVHRLVAEAFIPNLENKPQVDHINRNKSDNRVENLRWVTNSENHFNIEHRSKLSAFGVTKSYTQWAETYGVSDGTIIARLKRGWSAEDAVKIPPLRSGVKLSDLALDNSEDIEESEDDE